MQNVQNANDKRYLFEEMPVTNALMTMAVPTIISALVVGEGAGAAFALLIFRRWKKQHVVIPKKHG